MFLYEIRSNTQNSVVGNISRESEVLEDFVGDEDHSQNAAFIQGHAVSQCTFFSKGIDHAAKMPGITTIFVLIFFEVVDFLDHRQRDNDFVLAELVDGLRIEKNDVCI